MAWEDRAYNRDDPPRMRMSVPAPTPLAMCIMGACLLSFLVVNVFRAQALGQSGTLSFVDGKAFVQPWRWLTYAYLHGSGGHIFWNLLALYFFVPPLERIWGWRSTLAFYTLGTIAAGATFGLMCLFHPFDGLVGASGGLLAALGACAYLFPEMMFFGIVPIRLAAALFGVLYLLSIAGDHDASAAAHLGGLVFGFFAPFLGRRVWAWADVDRRVRRHRIQRAAAEEQSEQETVDRILHKVNQSGMNSLTWFERRALRRATERQRARDATRAHRVA